MTTTPVPATEQEGISPTVRRVLKKTVLGLRGQLEDDFRRQLAALGIGRSGTGDVPAGRTLSEDDARSRSVATEVLEREVAGGVGSDEALEFFVEECAFTFLNWAYGLRCLEERDLLIIDGQSETAIRVDPARGSSSLYWRVRNAPDASTNPRDVWRKTFRQACEAMSEQVSVLFDQSSEYAALFPLLPTVQAVVDALNAPDVAPETYATDELLGWVYQYFNAERKDEVFAAAGKGKKIEGEDIIAATQIYTERYMVDFLLQNSLGRMWVEMHPDTRLPERWPYYLAPPEDNPKVERQAKPLRDVTVLDPAVGSGHFLLRAADLLFEMYEEEGTESRQDIPRLVLERNLYGIDIDLRSVQIAALALYMKAATHVGGPLVPERLNLVAADVQLAGSELPKEYMKRFQGEKEMEDLVRAIWQGLHHVRELGSLLHPDRAVDEVLERRRARYPLEMQDDDHWAQWKRDLLNGLRDEFEKETETGDIGRRLLGAHVARGISLVELLSQKYDVVCTNPPYMGSGNMGKVLKDFVQEHYPSGKRDLYAAFILRCRELTLAAGFVAMVTQQSWMFLRSFADLRAISEEKLKGKTIKMGGILRDTSVEVVGHLGPHSFVEVGGEVVSSALFVLRNTAPKEGHDLSAVRLVGLKSPHEKAKCLRDVSAGAVDGLLFRARQHHLTAIPGAPIAYWISGPLMALLGGTTLRDVTQVLEGLHTQDPDRFVRFTWECPRGSNKWMAYTKGGGYQKWLGLRLYRVDWSDDGRAIRETGAIVPSSKMYFESGLTYSMVASGSLGVRLLDDTIFTNAGPGIFSEDRLGLMAVLNTRVPTYLLRSISPKISFDKGYVERVPVPNRIGPALAQAAQCCVALKALQLSADIIEDSFADIGLATELPAATSLWHTIEGFIETEVVAAYGLVEGTISSVLTETGTPAAWHAVIVGYDRVPEPPQGVNIPPELPAYFSGHEAWAPSSEELAAVRQRLRNLYVAGPGPRSAIRERAKRLRAPRKIRRLRQQPATSLFRQKPSLKNCHRN